MAFAASIELAELLMHGYDIAKSQGNPWTIDPARAILATRGISPVTEHYVDESAAAGFTGPATLFEGRHGFYKAFAPSRAQRSAPARSRTARSGLLR